jgi:hypothetical protein
LAAGVLVAPIFYLTVFIQAATREGCDEFTQLREIIVGDVTHARLPAQTDISAWLANFPKLTNAELAAVRVGHSPAR